jgi:NitT/TauT family transport system ATP-binding protein
MGRELTVAGALLDAPGAVTPPSARFPPAALTVVALSKTYGTAKHLTRAVDLVEFAVADGEFVSVVGPSGCGKTTLLKCIAGLLKPTAGYSVLRGERVTGPPAGLAVVFQDYGRSLYPWLTVRKNVGLPLTGIRRAARDKLVADSLEAVGLAGFADRHPWQLSGGMQQRVAIARALAYQPRVLLMDEPFASVDAQTRGELEDLVLNLRAQFGVTVLLVTHDIDEAVYMSNRIVVLTWPPSRVQDIITIDLPGTRDQIETKELTEFAQLRGRVYRMILSGKRDDPVR